MYSQQEFEDARIAGNAATAAEIAASLAADPSISQEMSAAWTAAAWRQYWLIPADSSRREEVLEILQPNGAFAL